MALVQRPAKQGGSTTYQGKVAQGFTKILSAEADADLDTIYAAWNGGADTVNISDGAVTAAKLAPGTLLWQVSGASLTPVDPTKNLTVAATGVTAKTRLLMNANGTFLLNNLTQPGQAQDDATMPSWYWQFNGSGYDGTYLWRVPAGSTSPRLAWSIDNTGAVMQQSQGASTAANYRFLPATSGSAECRISAYISSGTPMLDLVANWNQAIAASPVWTIRLNTTGDSCSVWRTAPNAGTQTVPLLLDSSGNLVIQGAISTGSSSSAPAYPWSVRVWGTGQGVRFQGTGTAASDGYSNAIAFGYTSPNITARVDSSNMGTVNVTPPSDARFKQDVREDVPGLATICALRPITFEYRQAMREVGFPIGRRPGLIAQEAREHVPFCIEDDGSDEHYLGLDYRALVPVLIAAVQELAAKLAALEGRGA